MGKPRQTDSRAGDRSRLGVGSFVVLAGLLVLPGWALYRGLGPTLAVYAGGWVSAVSLLALFVTWRDKRRAETQGWREPEQVLHLLELFGGWPGAFVAQRLFRHKTAKVSYQALFWLIVLLHQAVALDFLLGWPVASQVGRLLR